MKVYKIKNKDGRFSRGGYQIDFTKNGKTWNIKGALNNHISQIAGLFDYIDCTIVELSDDGIKEYPAIPWVQEIKIKKYENHKDKYGYYCYYDNKKEQEFIKDYEKFKALK